MSLLLWLLLGNNKFSYENNNLLVFSLIEGLNIFDVLQLSNEKLIWLLESLFSIFSLNAISDVLSYKSKLKLSKNTYFVGSEFLSKCDNKLFWFR